jgi:hypothetical protein
MFPKQMHCIGNLFSKMIAKKTQTDENKLTQCVTIGKKYLFGQHFKKAINTRIYAMDFSLLLNPKIHTISDDHLLVVISTGMVEKYFV